MSLVLTNAGEKLEILSTIVIPFTVHYADYVGATPAFTPGVAAGDTINGTKDLLAAPGSGQRVVRTISVYNDTGGAGLVLIQLDDGGVNYTIMTVVLNDKYSLYYDEDGWKVLDDDGALATTLFEHNILGPHHGDAATDAASRGSMIIGNATPAWDELIRPGTAYHLQTDANDIVWAQDITMADGAWQGIGAALERLVYNAAGYISVMGADLGVGTLTPGALADVYANINGFDNDGHLQLTNPRDTGGSTYVGINFSVRVTGGGKGWFGFDQQASYGRGDFVWLLDAVGDDNPVAMGDEVMRLTTAGVLKIAGLAGVGTRNVSADANGNLIIA